MAVVVSTDDGNKDQVGESRWDADRLVLHVRGFCLASCSDTVFELCGGCNDRLMFHVRGLCLASCCDTVFERCGRLDDRQMSRVRGLCAAGKTKANVDNDIVTVRCCSHRRRLPGPRTWQISEE